jgi:nucleotide-binding universal stress UspA family protein
LWNAREVTSQVFERVVCGVDGSPSAADAAAVAARVASPGGRLVLVGVDELALAVHAGFRMAPVAEQIATETSRGVREALAIAEAFHDAETRVLEGEPLDCLRHEIERVNATLAVVGTRGHSRAAGIALGSVTTHLLHEAPCSVLVVREPRDLLEWPRRILVGVDGSTASVAALAAAETLAARHDAVLRPVVATREAFVELERARAVAPGLEERDDTVLHTLHVLSEEADLLVVGSRGLRGIRALGSVSERIAHEARCSVLVVRAVNQ